MSHRVASPRSLVTSIVTTRNRASLLREALDSVFAQEGAGEEFEMEVIVVDDASTDNTPDVVAGYPTVRYIRFPERRDLSAARNAAVAASRGQFVAFLDDDDLWLPHKLRRQVPFLEAHPEAGAVYSHVVVRMGRGDRLRPLERRPPSGWIFPALLKENVLGGCFRFLIRRSALEVAGPFESLLAEQDYDLWLRLAFHFPILFLPGPVARWRPNPSGRRAAAAAVGNRMEEIRRGAENALGLLPDTATYAGLKQRARIWAEIRVVKELAEAHNAGEALAHMVESIRRYPAVMNDRSARDCIARTVRRSARTSGSPLSSAEAFCVELGAAVRGGRDRWALRRLLGTIWSEVAVGLHQESPRRPREAFSAVAQAARYAPAQLARRGVQALVQQTRRLT
jgi:glycosyltransferase involved in cell wall biosynthesis